MKKSRNIFLAYWLPVICWMSLIFILSHQDKDESQKTSEWMINLLNWLNLSPQTLLDYHVPLFIRKLAHITEYFILYLLTFRLLRQYYELPVALGLAWLICVGYAATDEYHQTFIYGRGGQIADVGVDSIGALLAGLWSWIKSRRVQVEAASFPEKL